MIVGKKIRAASAPAKETNSSCRWSHAQYYKRQVEQIKLLAAHYRPSEEGTSQDFKVTSCFDEGACKTARKSGHYNRRRGNKDVLEHVHAPDWKPGLFDAADVLGIGAEHNSDSAMEETATVDHTGTAEVNDGKISSKFTPKGSEEKGANFGANFGANWSQGCTCSTSLQPMKVAEQGASIINMPSLLQGQAFSDIPPEGVKVHKLHHRSISQPASRGFSYPAAPTSSCWQGQERPRETETTGWRRGAHSATMYTRYRSPEFALMYGDMESTTASCVWVLNNSECRKKLRVLTDDLSTKDLDADAELITELKLKRAKELSEKKQLLEPEVPRPRNHWYEMKTPDFHLEARKNNEHLRMLCT